VRRDGGVDGVLVGTLGGADADVEVLEVEVWVHVGGDARVGAEDVLEVDVDEEVKRVDVLLDESLDSEEGGEEIPLVLRGVRERVSDSSAQGEAKVSAPRPS